METLNLPWGKLTFSDSWFIKHATEYEKELWPHVTCPENGVACDIGAHQGFYTIKLAREAGLSGTIFAFEPSRENIEILEQNLNINLLAAVQPKYALSDYIGEGILFTYPKETSSKNFLRGTIPQEAYYTEFIQGKPNIKPPCYEQKVKVTTLDHYLFESAWHQILYRLDLIKIDAEGAELRILKGAQQTIKTFNPKIILEIHYNMLEEIKTFLTSLGYILTNSGKMQYSSNPYAIFQKEKNSILKKEEIPIYA